MAAEEAAQALTETLLPPEEVAAPDVEQPTPGAENESGWSVGEKQPSKCRDSVWAGLFVLHIVVVLVIAILWGVPALDFDPSTETDGDNQNVLHFQGALYLCLLSGACSVVIAGLSLGAMIHFAKSLVQTSVLFSLFVSLLMVIFSVFSGSPGGALAAFVMFLIGCFYAWRVWDRIPFAAANISTAVTAIRTNIGVTLVAFGMLLFVFGWTCLWLLSFVGVYSKSIQCNGDTCESHLSGWVVVLYLLSYFWTQQVIKNVIHVTVAGVVGTWWIVPIEASSCCSPAVADSFVRSVTYSFGSICFGSLIVATIQVLHQLLIQARREGEDNIFLCILECIISIIENVMKYFNKWAYIYVGIYGYPYMDAGNRVMTLFQNRGWTTIINDDLVSNALGLMTTVISALAGFVGMFISKLEPSWLEAFQQDATAAAFIMSFLIALVITSTLMSVIASGVDAVVVCFAETPAEFRENHPELSQAMNRAWLAAYPVAYGI